MIKPMTPELVSRFYGKPLPRTARGFAYLEGDEVKGLFGLYYDQSGERWIAFCEVRPEIRARLHEMGVKRAVVRAQGMLRELIERTPGRVQAAAGQNIDRAGAFLERMGFEHLTDEVYQWRR